MKLYQKLLFFENGRNIHVRSSLIVDFELRVTGCINQNFN